MTSDPFELLTLHVLIKTDWLFNFSITVIQFEVSDLYLSVRFIFIGLISTSVLTDAYPASLKKNVYWLLSRDCHIILTHLMWSQIMSVSVVTTYFEQHFEMMIIGEFSKMSKSSWWRHFTAILWSMCYWNERKNLNPRNCASCQTVFIRKSFLYFIYVYLSKSVFNSAPHI